MGADILQFPTENVLCDGCRIIFRRQGCDDTTNLCTQCSTYREIYSHHEAMKNLLREIG